MRHRLIIFSSSLKSHRFPHIQLSTAYGASISFRVQLRLFIIFNVGSRLLGAAPVGIGMNTGINFFELKITVYVEKKKIQSG